MLSRLRRRWFWHSGCIVGAAAHVAALHFSGNHLENMKSAKNILSVLETMGDISTAIFVSKGGEPGNYSCLLTRRRDGKRNGRVV
jgi:hypothetical protein